MIVRFNAKTRCVKSIKTTSFRNENNKRSNLSRATNYDSTYYYITVVYIDNGERREFRYDKLKMQNERENSRRKAKMSCERILSRQIVKFDANVQNEKTRRRNF